MPARNSSPRPLLAGTKAPPFSLKTTPDQAIALSDFKGKPVILAFYPADWSPVCGDELAIFNQALPAFREYGAQLLGISVDGAWCHMAFAQNRNLHFPLLADFNPKGEVAAHYGVYLPQDGEAARALFVIDNQGVIAWSYLSPIGVSPGADGILNALEDLQNHKTDKPRTTAQQSRKASNGRQKMRKIR